MPTGQGGQSCEDGAARKASNLKILGLFGTLWVLPRVIQDANVLAQGAKPACRRAIPLGNGLDMVPTEKSRRWRDDKLSMEHTI